MKINSPDIYSLKLNGSIGGSVGMGYCGELGPPSPWTPQIEIFDKTFIGSDFNSPRDLGVGFDNPDATMEIIPFESTTNIQIINAMVVNIGNGSSWTTSTFNIPLCLYGIGTDPGGKFVHCATIDALGNQNTSWRTNGSGSQFTTYFSQNFDSGKFPTFARGIYLGCHIGSTWKIGDYTGYSSIRVFGAFVRYPNRPGDLL